MNSLFLIVFVATLAISLLATWRVKRTYLRYSKVPASSGRSGAEVAAQILSRAGITDVEIAEHDEMLGDHYDPMNKRLVLLGHVTTLVSWAFIALCWVVGAQGIERIFHAIQKGLP